jgi:hypothetical protein
MLSEFRDFKNTFCQFLLSQVGRKEDRTWICLFAISLLFCDLGSGHNLGESKDLIFKKAVNPVMPTSENS